MARAVDTNVLVRALVDADDRQSIRATKTMAEGAWVSHVVLHELVWVAVRSYSHDHEDVVRLLEMMLLHEQIVLEEPLVVRAALDRFRQTPRLGFNDCLVLEVARARGKLPLMTFDRDLAKQDGAELA